MKKLSLKKGIILGIIAINVPTIKANATINLDSYLEKEIAYYNEYPNMIEVDFGKTIVIDERKNKNTITKEDLVCYNDFANICYIKTSSTGNSEASGKGYKTTLDKLYKEDLISGVIVGVKKNSEYPFAIASYDKDTNEIGSVIGWFKESSILSVIEIEYATIEIPITKHIDYMKDGYTLIDEENNIGIKVDYSDYEFKDYYINYNDGVYESKNGNIKVKKIDNININKKYNIKNEGLN